MSRPEERVDRHGGQGVIRVVAIASFTTRENDLVVAGTGGTLISWARIPDIESDVGGGKRKDRESNPHAKAEDRYVMVAWDKYMWNEIPEALVDGKSNDLTDAPTIAGRSWFHAAVHIDNIRIEGSR
ncbi:MAG TPA: hypothetical protein VFD36_29370 [Kofleriaceae bacterium]|nr:hypothetical protein [Kofleriaceae bacterium]